MAERVASGAAGGDEGGTLSRLLERLAAAPERDAGRDWARGLVPGEILDGRYEVVRELGRGGFGAVYDALDLELHRRVAVKTLRPGRSRDDWADEQLRKEARAAAQISHPGVVTLHEARVCEQGPYLVMELLKGETLAERLGRGPLPAAEVLEVGLQAARALAHIHAHGLLHRDLKPGNLFLGEDGRVKLLDLGLAHLLGGSSAPAGTPGYAAPEQWRGEAVDGRADVFALGAVLYEAASGRRAFEVKESRSTALDAGPPPALQGKPPRALARLVARCLEKEPSRRPTAAQAVEELLAAQRRIGRPPAVRRLSLLAGAAVAVGVALATLYVRRRGPEPLPVIAVLPFADLSPAKDQEYFADGVAEEILNGLTQLGGLRVIGRTSSFSFKGKAEDLRAVGQKLGAGTMLQGSVRRSGGRVRVTAQLVQAADGVQLWSRTFDRELSDVFAVQDEIARAVAGALRVKLLAGETVEGRGGTSRREAHDEYFLGRSLEQARTPESFERALAAYRRALAVDGQYAQAWAGVSRAMWFLEAMTGSGVHPDKRRGTIEAAERAIALAPDLAAGYLARAYARMFLFLELPGGKDDLERAHLLSPGDAQVLVLHGVVLDYLGRQGDAIATLERAAVADPLDAFTLQNLGRAHWVAGDSARAMAIWARSLEVAPGSDLSRYFMCGALLAQGKPAEALRAVAETSEPGFRFTCTAMAESDLGHARESRVALESLVAGYAEAGAYQVAQVHAWRGETDLAFEWLERARGGDAGIYWIKTDPLLRKIRGDPRFPEMLRKLKLPVD